MALKRKSWLDVLSEGTSGQPLRADERDALARLDDELFDLWSLGENMIFVWTRVGKIAHFLAVRHYIIREALAPADEGSSTANEYINSLLARDKFVDRDTFETVREKLSPLSRVISVSLDDHVDAALVSSLVTRYGVTLVRDRAVILLDAVGFALRSPLEQVAMLNSLSYSVNSAYEQLLSRDVQINFARTKTTGDGFYIWNRARAPGANTALYKLMMLILADNAIARRRSVRSPVPHLRAAFHMGEHYEFYQVEALNPTTFGYIVGPVTIELARMLEKALPGQIVLGDFLSVGDGGSDSASGYDTVKFIADTEATLDQLEGLEIGGDRIKSIRCYLTGQSEADGAFSTDRYSVTDKHGITHFVYNAKVNIHSEHAEPVFLGVQREVLHRHGAADFPWLVI